MSELAEHGAVWTEELRRGDEGRRRQKASPRRAVGRTRRGAARPTSLRLVADGGRLLPQEPGQGRAPIRTAAVRDATAARTPVRLTRRGRLVLTGAGVLAIGVVSLVLAGAAQATGHSGAPAGPGKAVTKVFVRPGDSLWSLAEAYDPNADTRLVIQDILQLNSMTTDQVQPGQVLWVPRG